MKIVGSRPPGPAAGVAAGVVAGSLVYAAWVNDLLLGIGVAGIAAGLVASLVWTVAGWERFGAGMLLGTLVTVAALALLLPLGGAPV